MIDLTQYPKIKEVGESVAQAAGAINREEKLEDAHDKLVMCMGAEGVTQNDLLHLEAWLNTLSKEELDTLADGEDRDVRRLMRQSPYSEGEGHVAQLFDDFWEAL